MNSNLRKITTSGILLAMGFVLSMITVFKLGNGGSITAASMAPIILISLRYGTPWGLLSGVTFAVLQMIQGFYPPPVQNFSSFLLVILLDYIIPFGCLGLASALAKPFGGSKRPLAVGVSSAIVVFIRLVSHVISGIIIWAPYAPEDIPVWLFSVQYNGSYMLVELVVTTLVMVILCRYIDFTTLKPATKK